MNACTSCTGQCADVCSNACVNNAALNMMQNLGKNILNNGYVSASDFIELKDALTIEFNRRGITNQPIISPSVNESIQDNYAKYVNSIIYGARRLGQDAGVIIQSGIVQKSDLSTAIMLIRSKMSKKISE